MTTVDLMYHKMKVEQGLVHLGLLEFYHFILRLCEQVCLACATGWELHTFTRTHARFHTQTHITHTHTPKAFPAEIGAHTSLCKLLDHQTRQEENT